MEHSSASFERSCNSRYVLILTIDGLDGSIKKNSAFVKKCKNVHHDSIELLLKELSGLKVDKYLDEIIGSLCENRFSKSSDALAAARLCVELHLRYEDFGQSMLKALWGSIEYIIL